uniref:Uncharacterized protein n=1 Tax=Rhizophora mucronata TaxID=61149 RepID=A0A2P2NYP9_RHIMU
MIYEPLIENPCSCEVCTHGPVARPTHLPNGNGHLTVSNFAKCCN